MVFIVRTLFLALILISSPLTAVENGFGLYLLGYQGPKAGYLPPPGFYMREDYYRYTGKMGGSILGGIVEAQSKMRLTLNLLTLSNVTDIDFLGGKLASTILIPIGKLHVKASASLVVPKIALMPGPGGFSIPIIVPQVVTLQKEQTAHGLADIFIAPVVVGWHIDNFHALMSLGMFLPTGKYKRDKIANMGQNHYALESDFGLTWLSPELGHEFSVYTGITKNFKNHKAHYESGIEWHTEFFAGHNFSSGVEFGLAGYYYHQLTGDTGSGAKLGSFYGRIAGLGPCIVFPFNIGKLPLIGCLRFYQEFYAKNHMNGKTLFFNISLPIPIP